MNWGRILLAALGGTVAYFGFGFIVFGWLPFLRNEYAKYPAIYRDQESMKPVMPFGMLAMFVAILVMVVLYAMTQQNGAGAVAGAGFGALIGLFAVCSFVIHNHVNLRIGVALTIGQAIAYFVEWTIVGVVIGLIYRPTA